MLIVALVLAVIGLAALVTAVVTSNELIAWVCIGASVIGVLLLIVDALRERSRDVEDGESDLGDRDDETTVIPRVTESGVTEPGVTESGVTESGVTEDYPDEPTEVVEEHEGVPVSAEGEPSAVGLDAHPDADSEAKRD